MTQRDPNTLAQILQPSVLLEFSEAFFFAWTRSRSIRLLAFGIPGLLMLTAPMLVIAMAQRSHSQVNDRYREEFVEAVGKKDLERAGWLSNRVTEASSAQLLLKQRTAEIAFEELILSAQASGQPVTLDQVKSLMAGTDEELPIGHFWIAEHLWETSAPPLSAETLNDIATHLETASRGLATEPRLHRRLGEVYLLLGEPQKAREQLALVADRDPQSWLFLCRLELEMGSAEVARELLNRGVESLEQLADQADPTTLLVLAEGYALQGRYAEAFQILERSNSVSAEADLLRRNILIAWLRDPQAPGDSAALRAETDPIQVALEFDESDPELNLEVIGTLLARGEATEHWPYVLQKALITKTLSPAAYHELAVEAHQRNDLAKAQEYWSIAHELDPQDGLIANNLAVLLMDQRPRSHERLIGELIEIARRELGDDPHVLETRGIWFERIGKFEDSINCLESALEQGVVSRKTHVALYRSYCGTGQYELADLHRRMAQRLE